MPPILVPMQDESTMNASGHCWSSGSYLHIVLSIFVSESRASHAQHYARLASSSLACVAKSMILTSQL